MWEDNDLVCCRPDGLPIDPDRFSKDFSALSQCLGLGVRLHDLRHSHISQLLGVRVHVVSERAGHKNAYVNLAIYAHTLVGMQWQAVEQLDAALRPYLRQAGPPGSGG
jgi:integrase